MARVELSDVLTRAALNDVDDARVRRTIAGLTMNQLRALDDPHAVMISRLHRNAGDVLKIPRQIWST